MIRNGDTAPIERKLRHKRPQRGVMIDGWYQVSAYWADGPDWRAFTTKVIEVHEGRAYYQNGEEVNLYTSGWLRDHHIPCFCPWPRRTDIS